MIGKHYAHAEAATRGIKGARPSDATVEVRQDGSFYICVDCSDAKRSGPAEQGDLLEESFGYYHSGLFGFGGSAESDVGLGGNASDDDWLEDFSLSGGEKL